MHSNLCLVNTPSAVFKYALYSSIPSMLLTEERPYVLPLINITTKIFGMTGYYHEQATRPDTLGNLCLLSNEACLVHGYLCQYF